GVHINPESRVKVLEGLVKPVLIEGGWTSFLVKIKNEAGVTANLSASSEQASTVYLRDWDKKEAKIIPRDRWLGMELSVQRPLIRKLVGINLEYRVIQMYSRDKGKRAAEIVFDVGQGTQDLGFRNNVAITFDCKASTPVTLEVLDENGKPTTAAFVFRGADDGRVYPLTAKRLAPDFFFHAQIYRENGEIISLPKGKYIVTFLRGPESVITKREMVVGDKPQTETFKVERWVDPSKFGYWSGDHHIHASGCAHYVNPTTGVDPKDIFKHIMGEDLKVGATLTWGPGFDHQKQFFSGQADKISKTPYLIRYDVEVSGFGSHRSGHLCLLRLKDQVYPGGDSIWHWPTLGLNTLKWAQKQGAVCGPAHSSWGLFNWDTKNHKETPTTVPYYQIPPFNGVGANEYIVDVTHMVEGPNGTTVPAVDFMSTVDTPFPPELNIWYHTLNCGYRTRVSGETDFPCVYDEKVGLGRAYVRVDGELTYDKWCEGIEKGTGYVSDGMSHIINFKVNGLLAGEKELHLDKPSTVTVSAKVAGRLEDKPLTRDEWQISDFGRPKPGEKLLIQKMSPYDKPYWHLERARIDKTKNVKVEVVVNGEAVAHKVIVADGKMNDISLDVKLEKSSWVAVRVLGSSHTNPVFVIVDKKPIRASSKSADWCLKSVNQCWKEKKQFYKAKEMKEAEDAYNHARSEYKKILQEAKEQEK
ncbi:MAG: CehA/McbA family metallohydrolase, partial [Lentisphaeraceae bacterium]|nr:CehA/McbA family metallohydrolase [Lentisphaeraceae bacterium]